MKGDRRFRIEVGDEHGTVALVIDPPDLDRAQRKAADRAVARMVGHMWAVLGGSEEHARQVLLAEVTRQYADQLTAARVEARRETVTDPQGRLF